MLAGRFTEAIALWQRCLEEHPALDPLGLRLAESLMYQGNIAEALLITQRAQERLQHPAPLQLARWSRSWYANTCHILRAEILLRQGNPLGFAHQLAQLPNRCASVMVPNLPSWDGSSALNDQHLLVTPTGGYGDQVLYCALLEELTHVARKITVAVHSDLAELFRASLPNVTLIATSMPQTLYSLPSMELQAAIALDPPDIQATFLHLPVMFTQLHAGSRFMFTPYLRVPSTAQSRTIAMQVQALRQQTGAKRLIGITWDRAQRHFRRLSAAVKHVARRAVLCL